MAEKKTSCQVEVSVSVYNFKDKYSFDVYEETLSDYNEHLDPGIKISTNSENETTLLRSKKISTSCPMGAMYTFDFATDQQQIDFIKLENSEFQCGNRNRKKTPASFHDLIFGKINHNDSHSLHLIMQKSLELKTIKLKLGAAEPKTTKNLKKVKAKLDLLTTRVSHFRNANNADPSFGSLL